MSALPPTWNVQSLAIVGLDVRSGLASMLGQQPLYVRMLRRFAGTQRTAAAELRAAWQTGDFKTAGRIAHTAKGLCGTIGAAALARRAESLEGALHDDAGGESVGPLIDAFEADLVPLCEALQAALPPA